MWGKLTREIADIGFLKGVTNAEDIDADAISTKDSFTDPGGVTHTGEIGGSGASGVQAAKEGMVVPVSKGLSLDNAIDPANTTTPISDARDAIVNNGSGDGAILYPPETITEAATYVQTRNFISHVGWGTGVSTVEFTDLANDGYHWDGPDVVNFDGISVSGSDNANRTGGSAWRFTGDAMTHWTVGHVSFEEWIDPIIHMDTSHLFSSTIGLIEGGTSNTGRLLFAQDSAGPGLTVHNVRYSPGDNPTAIQLGDGGGTLMTDAGAHFGQVNIGGSCGPVFEVALASNGLFSVDSIADFGTNGGTAKPYVVEIDSAASHRVGQIRTTGQPPSYDYVTKFGPNYARNTVLFPALLDGDITNTDVNVTAQGSGDFNILYLGFAGGVTNNSSAADGNTGVHCFASGASEA